MYVLKFESLLLITGNPGKAEEFKSLIDLSDLRFEHKAFELPEIQSDDIEEIGKYKTEKALNEIQSLSGFDAVLTDDTGLYCEALNGLPGPFIKWFLTKLGASGIFNLTRDQKKETSAVCLLTLGIVKSGEILQFRGEVRGKLVNPKGTGGFGWDPIFLPEGETITYGEMTDDQKNQISHRTLAVQKLRNWLVS